MRKGGYPSRLTEEQRKALVKEYLSTDKSLNEVGAEYGITGTHVRYWVKKMQDEIEHETMEIER